MNTIAALLLAALPGGAVTYPETILAPLGATYPESHGSSVSVQADTAIVGASGGDGVVPASGVVRVYRRVPGGGWVGTTKLMASDGRAGDSFGWAAELDGDRAVVGAHSADGVAPGSGAAYVFRRVAGGIWVQEAKLVAPVGEALDFFGASVSIASVSIDSARVLVGATQAGPPGAYGSGRAFVFVRSGTTWRQEAELFDPDPTAGYFGTAVSLDGDSLVVSGSRQFQGPLFGPGSLNVYTRQGSTWTKEAELFSSNTSVSHNFGASVALAGDRLVAGATSSSSGVPGPGAAYVFERTGTQWAETQELLASDGGSADRFGRSVALWGGTVVVGASGPNFAGTPGGAYVFESIAGGPWQEVCKITASNGTARDSFGHATSLFGGTLLVGAPGAGPNFTSLGSAYVYELSPPTVVYCSGKVNSAGCLPSIATHGAPSATDPRPFDITASNVIEGRGGLFLFGLNGRASLPFQGGTLCAQGPLRRTRLSSSGGGPPPPTCSGVLAIDFNAWVRGGHHAALVPGVQVNGQFFYRDPASPSTTGLSDAVEFVLRP